MNICDKVRNIRYLVCFLIVFTAALFTLSELEVYDETPLQPFGPRLVQPAAKFNRLGEQKRKNHIYFLKTHKCGSTTVYAIFLRFGYVYNLTFVLSTDKKFRGTISTKPFQSGKGYFLPPPKGEHYDILCHHTTYNRSGIEEVLPKDTMYIALVREPMARFISAFRYFSKGRAKQKYLTKIPGGNFSSRISNYLKNPASFEPKTKRGEFKWSYTNNGMANNFGFPPEDFGRVSANEIHKFIHKVDAEFDLVMVMEYLDESLVLMKRLLKWSTKDILYLGRENTGSGSTTDILYSLTEEDRIRHEKWESVDFVLYKHFSRKLLKKIKEGGDALQKEVNEFKAARLDVLKFCQSEIGNGKLVYITSTSREQFIISSSDCKLLKMDTYAVIDLLKQRKTYPSIPAKELKSTL